MAATNRVVVDNKLKIANCPNRKKKSRSFNLQTTPENLNFKTPTYEHNNHTAKQTNIFVRT